MAYRVLIATLVAVYAAMLLWSLPALSRFSGGQPIFDMRAAGYDETAARALLAALGPEGRGFYLDRQLWLDAVFPPLLAIFFILSFRRLYPSGPALALSVLALVYAAFDMGENMAVARLLRAGPDAAPAGLVAAASQLTLAKFTTFGVALVALIFGVFRRWRQGRRRNLPPT